MIILSILGYILLFILVIILAIILIPYSYFLEIDKNGELKIGGFASWLFGGLKVIFLVKDWKMKSAKVSIFGLQKNIDIDKQGEGKKKGKDLDSEEISEKEKEKEKNKKDKKTVKSGYFKKEIISKLIETIKKAWRHLRPNRINARLVAGFDDPMYTGLLCALFSQTWILDERYDIWFQPSFDEEIIKGKASIEGRIWIAYILVLGLGLLLTKPLRKMLFS